MPTNVLPDNFMRCLAKGMENWRLKFINEKYWCKGIYHLFMCACFGNSNAKWLCIVIADKAKGKK